MNPGPCRQGRDSRVGMPYRRYEPPPVAETKPRTHFTSFDPRVLTGGNKVVAEGGRRAKGCQRDNRAGVSRRRFKHGLGGDGCPEPKL
jgi:hypothetical protein